VVGRQLFTSDYGAFTMGRVCRDLSLVPLNSPARVFTRALGQLHFCSLIGTNLNFLPSTRLGLMGTAPPGVAYDPEFAFWNDACHLGAFSAGGLDHFPSPAQLLVSSHWCAAKQDARQRLERDRHWKWAAALATSAENFEGYRITYPGDQRPLTVRSGLPLWNTWKRLMPRPPTDFLRTGAAGSDDPHPRPGPQAPLSGLDSERRPDANGQYSVRSYSIHAKTTRLTVILIFLWAPRQH